MALVSGPPASERGKRLLMVLQAYIDDSGSDGANYAFVLGGFVADHAKWGEFSDEWQTALDLEPKLSYFKMTEAASLHGQFHTSKGRDEKKRDGRVILLADIVAKHTQIKIHSMIKNEDFNTHIRTLPAFQRSLATDSPFTMLATQLSYAVAIKSYVFGITEPCDFIFDETNGFDDDLSSRWNDIRAISKMKINRDIYDLIGSKPIFRDEKKFKPLQAADLYARNVRQNWTQNKVLWTPPNRALRALGRTSSIERVYSTEEIIRLRNFLIAQGEHIKAINPDFALVHRSENKRERKNARLQARKKLRP